MKTNETGYCIRGNSRATNKKEVIRDGFATKEAAEAHLANMAKIYSKTHTYARVAKSDAYVHPTQRP
jgi:hypothetical protein